MSCPNVTLIADPKEIRGMRGKPSWFKIKLPSGKFSARYEKVRGNLKRLKLVTVCEEAKCPNISECWGGGTATFMLMGDTCTRACRFCAIKTGNPKGVLDPDEPRHLAQVIAELQLDYAVITSVDRDDLPDGGASHFAECVRYAREFHPKLIVELLTPDFRGKFEDIEKVVESRPHVFGHNVETVPRLQHTVRDWRANYEQSLSVLKHVKDVDSRIYTKSSVMLGLGEKEDEIISTMKDLRAIGVDIFTLGQYLRPSSWHLPVDEFISPEQFDFYKKKGEELGFLYVASGPFVRSSYKAGELFMKNVIGRASHGRANSL